jgi:hypothetical protein
MAEAVAVEMQRGEREQEENDADPEDSDPRGGAGLWPARHIRHAGIK